MGEQALLRRGADRRPPGEINRFVGRADALRTLADLQPRTRLLTLTGPSGVGKTRLAARVAAEVAPSYVDGVTHLDVSAMPSAEVLGTALATTLGIPARCDSDDFEDLAARLTDYTVLLVLDTCDRLLAHCGALAAILLGACPRLQIIATSCERLGVAGETMFPVPPMDPPAPHARADEIAENEAVQLLLDRLVEVNPHLTLEASNAQLIAEICRRSEGLPLALELVAGWISTLSLAEIAQRLERPLELLTRGARGGPSRHRTLRASLDWSTDQLDDAERRLLRRAAVFATSWDLDAARVVCADADLPLHRILPVLADLVSKSLVQVVSNSADGPARYRMLDAMRQYELELLEAALELPACEQRHAAWYHGLAESIQIGQGRSEQLDRLLRDQDNLRTALAWAVRTGDVDKALGLAVRLHAVWYIQGQFAEAQTWFKRILELDRGAPAERTTIAYWASMHAVSRGEFAEARRLAEDARRTAADVDDPSVRVLSHDGEATILLEQGRLDEAAAGFERELKLLRDIDMDWLRATVLYRLASIELERGNTGEAERMCADALVMLDIADNPWIEMRVQRVLGRIARERGEPETARRHFESALTSARALGDVQGQALTLIDVAELAHTQRSMPTARATVREALDVTRCHGEPLAQLRCLEAAAALLARARPEGCIQLLSASRRLRAGFGVTAWPLERRRMDRALQIAHGRLSTSAATVAWASGERMSSEHARRLACELLESLDLSSAAAAAPLHEHLTPRELAVAELLRQGLTNRAIARRLVISHGTVRAHVEHILSKLGLRSRTEIGARLDRMNLAQGGK